MNIEGNDIFLAFSDLLQNEQRKNRDAVSSNGASHLGDLIVARTACTACIGSILSRRNRAFPTADERSKISRSAVHSAIVQGIHFVEYTIENGAYAQAAALVRQEIDAAVVTNKIRLGERRDKDKNSASWSFLPNLSGWHGILSGLAHMSDHSLLLYSLSNKPASVDYTFNPLLARKLFGLHVCALIYVIFDMIEFTDPHENELMNTVEQWWLNAAVGVVVKEGLIPLPNS